MPRYFARLNSMSNGATSILLDTNILLSKTLRDWILLPNQILNKKYFDIHTTQNILDEWGGTTGLEETQLEMTLHG